MTNDEGSSMSMTSGAISAVSAEGYRYARSEGSPAGEVLKEGWREKLREGLYYWDDQVPDQAVEIMERQIIPAAG